jgi:hypothetical protein
MATCKECGKKIRQPKDMSVGAASRIHYWKFHREVMMRGVRKAAKTMKAKKPTTKAKR